MKIHITRGGHETKEVSTKEEAINTLEKLYNEGWKAFQRLNGDPGTDTIISGWEDLVVEPDTEIFLFPQPQGG